jgi:DNA-binding transcriptional LysR family regulator
MIFEKGNHVQSILERNRIQDMNIKTFDLNLLRVFAAVYAERNVSKAAVAAGLSQPAMSNALLRLRKACSDVLFIRTSRGMEPTALAEELIDPVRHALSILQASLEHPHGFDPRESERTFKILMSDAGEAIVLPQLVPAVLREAPHVRIEALRRPNELYSQMLQSGEADLAIGNLAFLKTGFYQQRLFGDPYCCLVRRKHPSISGELTLKQFLEAQHVSVATGNADALVERTLAKMRAKRKVVLRVTHYHVAADVVERSNLVVTVPRNAARNARGVQILPVPLKIPAADVRQFWHSRAHKNPANQWLRSMLAKLVFE